VIPAIEVSTDGLPDPAQRLFVVLLLVRFGGPHA
jgi:hypothetical protein